ncbi:MAG: 50S ribosomal protein L17 [Verrucomicrobia bacterium]|nr:50S ribosomal protein L17 [Verrucomicrobiota bacterium]MDA1064923.1 50S ribosomal protein L17 [Verrucomicrobiota bacterium]
MRHLKHRHELGVKKAHRPALMANLAMAIIKEGRIKTTLAKARALRPFIEKLITLAKRGTLADRRLANSRIRNKEAVQILFNEKVEEFKDRQGGYTRIYKIGNRIGDAAEMALIELIPAGDEGYGKKRKAKKAAKKPAAAKAVEAVVAEEVETSESEAKAEAVVVEEPEAEAEEAKVEEPVAEAEVTLEAEAVADEPEPEAEEESKK